MSNSTQQASRQNLPKRIAPTRKQLYIGVAAAVAVTLVWAGWFIISKWGVTHSLTNADILLLRFATASAVISLLLFGYKRAEIPGLFRPQVILVSLGVGVPYVWLSLTGLEQASTAQGGVLVNGCMPIFTLCLLYLVTRIKPNLLQIGGIALILGGNIVLIADQGEIFSFGYPQLALLGASLCIALYTVGTKVWDVKLREIMIVSPLINLVATLPLWLSSESNIAQAPLSESLLQASYQGILVSVIVLWLMGTALKYITARLFSLIMAMVPISTAILAFFTLGEALTLYILAGAVLCVFGIVAINFASHTSQG